MAAPTIEAAMAAVGLCPAGRLELQPDGQLRRFRVEGDRPGSLNGWAVLYGGPLPAGAFGSWKTGLKCAWRGESDQRLTPEELEGLRRHQRAAEQARLAEQERVHAEAAARAARLWQRARPASGWHPYLLGKGVAPHGLRQLGESLLIPVRSVRGELVGLQFIQPDGSKRFLTGTRKRGAYHAIGKLGDWMLLAEGYATAATLYEATTDFPVAVCFDAGNLMPVAQALRGKFPGMRFLVCADNDAGTAGNPGLTHAREAAEAVGGYVAWPVFEGGRAA